MQEVIKSILLRNWRTWPVEAYSPFLRGIPHCNQTPSFKADYESGKLKPIQFFLKKHYRQAIKMEII